MLHLFYPGRVRANLPGVLFVETLDIRAYLWIIGLPVVQVPKEQMVISALNLAQRNQVARIKLQFRVKMERLDMVNLQSLPPIATGDTGWLVEKMLLLYSRPFRTPFTPVLMSHLPSVVSSP